MTPPDETTLQQTSQTMPHVGFFRSRSQAALWDQPLDWLEQQVQHAGH